MDAVFECVCGLDVHAKTVQACIRRLEKSGKFNQEIRSFGTMTRDIVSLCDWLTAAGVTHVAMESTGVYWKPIYNILENRFTLLLINARHVKNVPGRKTDVKDCQWLAQLLQCGLLQGSFIPDAVQRELRDLTRHRSKLTAERSAVANRIHKTLEDANIKLNQVASDILGVSGRDILRALINGKLTPQQMANLSRGALKSKIPDLEIALEGRVTDHHRFMLAELMNQLEDIEQRIERFSARIREIKAPFSEAVEAVATLPGFDQRSAENVVAEIGTDMTRSPTPGNLASWAGICPGNNESAGKRKSGKTTKGSQWLKAALVQAAFAASHTKSSYFRAQYHRLVPRRGKKRALVAVAHSLLVVIHKLLLTHCEFKDLGPDYFDKRDEERVVRRTVNRLKALGFDVALTKAGDAA